ncbi:aldo/keto reductase [Nocardia farcinica]|uniref:aldo/keto reductase n=1 Tax=Nocardia farcinica TaxID=37329 RepID=UPI001893D440|nr:aldo/keto reductase [Nocardia farcinica]MBF6258380.1 aldo/keto reductase [Nocardia farcinica]
MSTLALGTAVFGVAPREEDAAELIHVAVDAGINFIDTANSYGNQARFDRTGIPDWTKRRSAEEIVGEAIEDYRDQIVLASKVSEPIGNGPNDGSFTGGGLSRTHIMRNIERSLDRLRTDHIDIYYAHHPDPLTDIEESLRAFGDLVGQGMITYYALSTFDGWQLTEAMATAERLGLPKPVCHQTRYSLAKRWVETEVLPATNQAKLGTVAYGPLAGGLLTDGGTERQHAGDARWGGSRFTQAEIDLSRRLAELGAEWELPPAHIALAWVLAQPGISSALVGPETVTELYELIPAMRLTLTSEQLKALDEISTKPANLYSQ